MENIELKNGMFVELADGTKGVVVKEDIVYQDGNYDNIDYWDNDLKAHSNFVKNKDIIRVYRSKSFNSMTRYFLIWERPKEILDKQEKEYLSAVIKPFRNRVNFISKSEISNFEYISILLKDRDEIGLPNFTPNTMYKNMELEEKYTLEELGL